MYIYTTDDSFRAFSLVWPTSYIVMLQMQTEIERTIQHGEDEDKNVTNDSSGLLSTLKTSTSSAHDIFKTMV